MKEKMKIITSCYNEHIGADIESSIESFPEQTVIKLPILSEIKIASVELESICLDVMARSFPDWPLLFRNRQIEYNILYKYDDAIQLISRFNKVDHSHHSRDILL